MDAMRHLTAAFLVLPAAVRLPTIVLAQPVVAVQSETFRRCVVILTSSLVAIAHVMTITVDARIADIDVRTMRVMKSKRCTSATPAAGTSVLR